MSVSLISTISESSVEVANRALTDQEKALQGKGSRALVCEGKNGTYPRLGLKGWSRNAHVFAGAALLGQVNSCPQADLNRESLGRVCALAAFAVAWLMISAHESTISSSMKRILDLNLEECRWPCRYKARTAASSVPNGRQSVGFRIVRPTCAAPTRTPNSASAPKPPKSLGLRSPSDWVSACYPVFWVTVTLRLATLVGLLTKISAAEGGRPRC